MVTMDGPWGVCLWEGAPVALGRQTAPAARSHPRPTISRSTGQEHGTVVHHSVEPRRSEIGGADACLSCGVSMREAPRRSITMAHLQSSGLAPKIRDVFRPRAGLRNARVAAIPYFVASPWVAAVPGLRRSHGLLQIPWTAVAAGPRRGGDPVRPGDMSCGDLTICLVPTICRDNMASGGPRSCRNPIGCGDPMTCGGSMSCRDPMGCGGPKTCCDPMGCDHPGGCEPMACGDPSRRSWSCGAHGR